MALLFFQKDLPASHDADLELAGFTSETELLVTKATRVARVFAILTSKVTANGPVTVEVRKDGTAVITLSIADGDNADAGGDAQLLDVGDRLTVHAETPAGFTPTTEDLLVLVE